MLTVERRDRGSITVLVIGYTAIAAVLVAVGVDVSKVFLARRSLSAAADSAALAAAQGIDRQAVYNGSALRCGQPLPLSRSRAGDLAGSSVREDRTDLGRTFTTVAAPQTTVRSGTVTVELSGRVALPFGPSEVQVSATSSAASPVTGGTC
jgi:uncharacterized membrane protein